MELKDFIENILVDIAEGVTTARDKVRDKIAINPASVDGKVVVEKDYINFDIAITANEKSEISKDGSIKGGVHISVLSADASKTMGELNSSGSEKISRVSFRVPVYYGADFKKKNIVP